MKIVKSHDNNLVIILTVFIRFNVCPCGSGKFCWCLILAYFFRFEYSQKIIIASPRCFGRFCRGADWGIGIYKVGDNFWWEGPTKDNNCQILGGECSIGLQLATRRTYIEPYRGGHLHIPFEGKISLGWWGVDRNHYC